MRLYPSIRRASQRLNSIRFSAKDAVQLLTALLLFSLCLFPNLATAQSPHIYVSPQAGSPGSQAQVLGTGFDPNATIDLYFDTIDVGVALSGGNGSFGMTPPKPTPVQGALAIIQVPEDAVPGQHWITAVERITQLQAQLPFTVWTANWPQFHYGPDHTGFNPNEHILNSETVKNLTTRWTYPLAFYDGKPVVANGVVYVGAAWDGLYALNAWTGALLWKYPVPPVLSSTLAVADGVVYFTATGGYLYALNATSGIRLWQQYLSQTGNATPTVVNGIVYIGNGDVFAVDAHTGSIRWRYPTGEVLFGPRRRWLTRWCT